MAKKLTAEQRDAFDSLKMISTLKGVPKQALKSIKGQILNGDVQGAVIGMERLRIERRSK